MAFSGRTKDRLYDLNRYICCEICGSQCPALENKGLQAAHILSDSSDGPDAVENAMTLCHRCAEVFDRFIKAKIAIAFEYCNHVKGTEFKCPVDWITGEGRRAKGDNIDSLSEDK
jgi:hypothetical protein